jgi:hypothetical protein
MSMNLVVAGALSLISLGAAHTAGAGYVLASQSAKSSRWAIVRTIFSIALAALALRMAG